MPLSVESIATASQYARPSATRSSTAPASSRSPRRAVLSHSGLAGAQRYSARRLWPSSTKRAGQRSAHTRTGAGIRAMRRRRLHRARLARGDDTIQMMVSTARSSSRRLPVGRARRSRGASCRRRPPKCSSGPRCSEGDQGRGESRAGRMPRDPARRERQGLWAMVDRGMTDAGTPAATS